MYDRILIPTDGSEGAERATRRVLPIARAFDATVHVVSVVDARQYGSTDAEVADAAVDDTETEADAETKARLEREGREAVAAVEALLDDGVEVVTDLLTGVPHEEILDYAADEEVGLIAMSTQGRTGLDRILVGSTAERVIRLSDRPVLTVGPKVDATDDDYRNVLVPTDGSEGVEPAVAAGLDLSEAFGATVHALHVVDVRVFITGEGYGDYVDDLPKSTLGLLEAHGEEATDRIVERAEARGLDAASEVLKAAPPGGILDYAEDRDVDLVVMGTHGRTGLDRYLLGSVAEHVVRHADVPVLTVRRPDE